MRLRDIIGLAIALVLAIGVAFLTRVFLTQEDKTKEEAQVKMPTVEMTKILVAGRVLKEGDSIGPGDLIWQPWPQKALTSSYIQEGTLNLAGYSGAIVRFYLDKGEPVLVSDLVKPGDRSALAAILSPGKRAISIDVTAQSASSGLITPGDNVDVILSKKVYTEKGEEEGKSETVVNDVKVLAIDMKLSSMNESPKFAPHVATLEVTPEQAEAVTAASKSGSLSLSLHSLEKGNEPAVKVEKEPENNGTVTLLRGKEKEVIHFQ